MQGDFNSIGIETGDKDKPTAQKGATDINIGNAFPSIKGAAQGIDKFQQKKAGDPFLPAETACV